MIQDWSQEPWTVANGVSGRPNTVRDAADQTIGIFPQPEGGERAGNATRVVACVNAFAGVPTELVGMGPLLRALKALSDALRPVADQLRSPEGLLLPDDRAMLALSAAECAAILDALALAEGR